MLEKHKGKVELTGGLEPARLKPWHLELMRRVKVQQFFLAYDTPDDLEPLKNAAQLIRDAGFDRHKFRTYTLIGWPKDTFEEAEKRMLEVVGLGSYPMAMLWKNERGETNTEWRRFSRNWARPAIISERLKEMSHC